MKASLLATVALLGVMASPALAEPFTYAPEHCEFQIAFPEKPYIEQKCTTGDTKVCAEVLTYTRVINAESSVNVRVTCKVENEKELVKYTPEIMKETIKQMTSQAKMDVETISTDEIQGYKTAAAVNVGERGGREIMYTAQIWIGKTSLFTLEADMTGPQEPKADEVFTDILKSMKPKDLKASVDKPATPKP